MRGFTLVELLISIAVIAILSAIVLFSIILYINRSRDAATQGNLSTLIPAGEVYYDHNDGEGYVEFCNSDIVLNLPSKIGSLVICKDSAYSWAACVKEFETPERAFCVDSRGYKKEICADSCNGSFTSCPEQNVNEDCN